MSLPEIDPLQQTEQILTFIRNAFKKANKSTAIVAVSGGLDSAVSLTLAAKALNPDHVYSLFLPSRTTPPEHRRYAQTAIDHAQVPPSNQLTIPIGSIIQKNWRIIRHHTLQGLALQPGKARPYIDRLRLANLTARVRMSLLFDQAKRLDALVIGTENLSEHLLGYYTRYGDEASDLEPIRHLYKTQVIELAKYLEIPSPIINQPPSAGLWPGQTDANELGFTYQEADPIIHLIHQGKTTAKIIELGYPSKLADRVQQTINTNHFKHQVPYHLSLT